MGQKTHFYEFLHHYCAMSFRNAEGPKITITIKGVQMHPRRRKLHHRNPRGTKIRKLGGQSLKLLPPDVIF